MSVPSVARELMMGWWGVGFGGGTRPAMRVMQSSPLAQCLVIVGCGPAVCGVPNGGSCQGTCVGARSMEAGWGRSRAEGSQERGEEGEEAEGMGGG